MVLDGNRTMTWLPGEAVVLDKACSLTLFLEKLSLLT
jgi:hypothetical protein